jgi:hypothetical protein
MIITWSMYEAIKLISQFLLLSGAHAGSLFFSHKRDSRFKLTWARAPQDENCLIFFFFSNNFFFQVLILFSCIHVNNKSRVECKQVQSLDVESAMKSWENICALFRLFLLRAATATSTTMLVWAQTKTIYNFLLTVTFNTL